jgi:hypothetical protein
MTESENLGSFAKDNKNLLKDYLQTRLEIYKLQAIRMLSKTAGYFIWIIILLFLLFVFIIFGGIVTGLWLSDVTGSYVTGFGITTMLILLLTLIITAFRHVLFVNPIIRAIIRKTTETADAEENNNLPS